MRVESAEIRREMNCYQRCCSKMEKIADLMCSIYHTIFAYHNGYHSAFGREWVVIPISKSEQANVLAFIVHRQDKGMKMVHYETEELIPDPTLGAVLSRGIKNQDLFEKYVYKPLGSHNLDSLFIQKNRGKFA